MEKMDSNKKISSKLSNKDIKKAIKNMEKLAANIIKEDKKLLVELSLH